MKKVLALLLALILVLSLAACGESKPSGTYTTTLADMPYAELTFDGDSVEYRNLFSSGSVKRGTFTMNGDSVVVSYEDGLGDTFTYDKEKDTLDLAGTFVFEKK